jgi:hypothetical protein
MPKKGTSKKRSAAKKNPAAVAMAKLRAKSLSPARRKAIARAAIKIRWAKHVRLGKKKRTD